MPDTMNTADSRAHAIFIRCTRVLRAHLAVMAVGATLLAASGNGAFAQDGSLPPDDQESQTQLQPLPDSFLFWDMEIGVGGKFEPRYQGSDSYRLSPYPIVDIKRLKIGGLEIGGEKAYGLSIYPSFMLRNKRDDGDGDRLRGLPDVDRAFELGLGLAYEQENYKIFAQGRNGVVGHHGWTGEVGFDLKSRPTPQWSFTLGPRVSFADQRYTDEYFGISRTTRHFDETYRPGGGIKSWGAEASAKYRINSEWSWVSSVEYDRLTHNAGDSPIVESKDQWIVRSGLSYRFRFGFKDQSDWQ